jgi:hypothetical protein
VDIEVILDAAEVEAPGLREPARRSLQAKALHLGVLLDVSSVIARQAEGLPELHITGPAPLALPLPWLMSGQRHLHRVM